MTIQNIKKLLNSPEIKKIFEEMWLDHLYLVGSYARWENKEKSDIDLLYSRSRKKGISALAFMKKKSELEQKLWKKIDMVNEKYVYQDIKPYLEQDKILIY